jgi:hemerythrin superfamily protein
MLKGQHREVEGLFAKFEEAGEKATKSKQSIFDKIADALAMHATIEERHFYPAVKAKRTEDICSRRWRSISESSASLPICSRSTASNETFDAKVKVLKEQVEHHVEEEESDLFPRQKLPDKRRAH